jgi:hypothetical protein
MESIGESLPETLRADPDIVSVEFVGSRARGTAKRFSDWDFVVRAQVFASLAERLPQLCGRLDPLAQQWDRLSDHQCYMLILEGPTKVDLIFADEAHEHEPPWSVGANTLCAIDDHFWDWSLWLASKVDAAKDDVVRTELPKMHRYLLEPMGVARSPETLLEAVDIYLKARVAWERRLATNVNPRLGAAVAAVVRAATEPPA